MIRTLIIVMLLWPAFARDDGRYAQSPLKEWIRGLKDRNSVSCCDEADGEDVDGWDIRDGAYWVRVKGQWLIVPPVALLEVPNRLGFARAWVYFENGTPKIRCFLPGAGG